jgi:hypothetical protein
LSQNPNYNPYNPNPSDPNQNPGTSYGGAPPPPPPGQGSSPNYNPYPGNPLTPGPGAPPPPNTNYDPYNPYQADPTVRNTSGPPSNPNYYPYGPNDPTVRSSTSNPNYAQYQQVPPAVPPIPSGPPPSVQRPRRTGRLMAIIGGVLVLLIIAAIIIVVAANNNATATSHMNATATARVNGTAQANTAATAGANATANANATASAVASATAAAALVNPYPPGGGTLAINDPLTDNSQGNNWFDNGTACTFTGGAYQVSISQAGFVQDCLTQAKHFSDFVYQVQMTITQGDAGGVVFRVDDPNNNYYYFRIDLSGNYELDIFNSSGGNKIAGGTSSAIHTQLNQPNIIGIVAQGGTIDAYVNSQHVATFHDSKLVQGRVGVAAEDVNHSTTVSFSDLKVWIL